MLRATQVPGGATAILACPRVPLKKRASFMD